MTRTSIFSLLVIIFFVSQVGYSNSLETVFFEAEKLEALREISTEKAFTGSVTGKVLEAGTNEPLIGASVLIKGTLKGDASDVDGDFTIRGIDAGVQTLVVSYLGFKTREIEIEITDGETVEIEIILEWEGVQGEEVTITAQARGQVAAINQQLQSNTISNIVSKDRIQDIPDVNAAESIGRLPGVAIQRDGGEANKVLIRGLSPKFSSITVNGVRIPSTGSDDRSVDLSLISSNMLDGIEVKKAITPDMDGDAIAGSVDLKLREAPEGFQWNANLQGGYTELQEYYENYKINASISDRLFDSNLGYIATFSADQYDRSADQLNVGYDTFTNPTTNVIDGLLIQSVNAQEYFNLRSRIGGSALFDYKIPDGKITGNIFYNRQKNDGHTRTNNIFNVNGRAGNDLSIFEGTTEILTTGLSFEKDFEWIRVDGGISRSSSLTKNPRDYFVQFRMESSIAEFVQDENGVPIWPLDTLGVQPIGVLPFVQPNDTITVLGATSINSLRQEEINYTNQINFTLPFDLNDQINGHVKFGGKLRWLDRSNDQEGKDRNWAYMTYQDYNEVTGEGGNEEELMRCIFEQTGSINGFNLFDELVVNNETAFSPYIPITYFNTGYDRNNFLTGEGGDGFPIGYAPGVSDMQRFLDAADNCMLGSQDAMLESPFSSRANDYTGNERYGAAYIMSEISLGQYVTFIPGVRWENDYSTYQTERFNVIYTQNVPSVQFAEDIEIERDYNFILPMFHLQVDPNEWLKIRAAYTETLARPDFTLYIPRANWDVQNNAITANNSALKPSESVNYDLSASVYQNHVGLFTVSGFQKTISDLPIWTRRFLTAQDTLTAEEAENLNIPFGGDNEWAGNGTSITTYENAPFDTEVWGVEFDWQTNFWYLPSVLKGLVLNINYTRMFSETSYRTTIQTGTLCVSACGTPFQTSIPVYGDSTRTGRAFDQPAHLLNVTLGYDYKGFSGRFSYLFQGDRLTGMVSVTRPVQDSFSDEYRRWDITLKQSLGEAIELYGNFSNLTSTPDRNLIGDGEGDSSRGFGSTSFVQYYGFTMDLGVRLRF
ncbi:MAG: TonB-dependent receptor [Balneola sp.]|nr:MAG: TonB-dependent receptor [Balneola sp.]